MKQLFNKTNFQQIKLQSTYSRIKNLSDKHIGEKINIKVFFSSSSKVNILINQFLYLIFLRDG